MKAIIEIAEASTNDALAPVPFSVSLADGSTEKEVVKGNPPGWGIS